MTSKFTYAVKISAQIDLYINLLKKINSLPIIRQFKFVIINVMIN